jgi:hypothetical protein
MEKLLLEKEKNMMVLYHILIDLEKKKLLKNNMK